MPIALLLMPAGPVRRRARDRHLLVVPAVGLPHEIVPVAEVCIPQLSRHPFGIEDHMAT